MKKSPRRLGCGYKMRVGVFSLHGHLNNNLIRGHRMVVCSYHQQRLQFIMNRHPQQSLKCSRSCSTGSHTICKHPTKMFAQSKLRYTNVLRHTLHHKLDHSRKGNCMRYPSTTDSLYAHSRHKPSLPASSSSSPSEAASVTTRRACQRRKPATTVKNAVAAKKAAAPSMALLCAKPTLGTLLL
jgi:hypothetical protein